MDETEEEVSGRGSEGVRPGGDPGLATTLGTGCRERICYFSSISSSPWSGHTSSDQVPCVSFLFLPVQSVKNKPLFFADKLYKSMKGAGTDEKTLTRIMVSRSEINLLNRRREFIEKYDKSLHQAIEGDTSGHFLKALLAICGGED